MDAEFIPRVLETVVKGGLKSHPVVVVEGARTVGKTRLLERLRSDGCIGDVRTFLNAAERAACESDVDAYVASLPTGTAIDEAQLVPDLLTSLKRRVDTSGSPGQFVLTGSTRLRRDGLAGTDPLAGRALTLRLEPFSQSELTRTAPDALERMLGSDPSEWEFEDLDRDTYLERATRGGMPLSLIGGAESNLASYVDDLTLRSATAAPDGRLLQALLRVLCSPTRVCSPISYASLSQELGGADARTIKRYIGVLESLFLMRIVHAFDPKLGISEARQAKAQPLDPALVVWASAGSDTPETDGALLETFVGCELTRLASARPLATTVTHFRETRGGKEVDRVVDCGYGPLLAVEVKATGSPDQSDFAGIEAFAKLHHRRTVRGFVLCCVDRVLPFGQNRWAVPISSLWHQPAVQPHDEDPFERALRLATEKRRPVRPEDISHVMAKIVVPRLKRIAQTISGGYGTVVVTTEPEVSESWAGAKVAVAATVRDAAGVGFGVFVVATTDANGGLEWTWTASIVRANNTVEQIIGGGPTKALARDLEQSADEITVQVADAIPLIGDAIRFPF